LGSIQELTLISASFLQNTRSWIFYPAQIEYFISIDGEILQKFSNTKSSGRSKQQPGYQELDYSVDGKSARYIKVVAKNVGVCPDWHVAAGGKNVVVY
jgi:hypothetical protein